MQCQMIFVLLICTQLNTEDGVTRAPDKIVDTFREYYQNLYSSLQQHQFDEIFKTDVKNTVKHINVMNKTLPNSA